MHGGIRNGHRIGNATNFLFEFFSVRGTKDVFKLALVGQ